MASNEHGLGRRLSPDNNDFKYLMTRRLAKAGVEEKPTRKTWRLAARSLDQGATSCCVGFAWQNFLRCEPMQTTSKQAPNGFAIYRRAVQLDVWTDNDHEYDAPNDALQSGTSVRAGAEAVMGFGRLKSYVWAFDIIPVIEWLRTEGPCVFGTDWPESFMNPDKEGIVRLGANPRFIGGHAYLARGIDLVRELMLFENSWSDEWGRGGGFLVPLRDVETLIRRDGECAAAIEQRLKAA